MYHHWGSHVEIPNSQMNIWLASSLEDYSTPTAKVRVQAPAETRLFAEVLLEDLKNFGQVSS